MGIIASTISIIGIGCFLTVNTHAEKTKPEKKKYQHMLFIPIIHWI